MPGISTYIKEKDYIKVMNAKSFEFPGRAEKIELTGSIGKKVTAILKLALQVGEIE